MLSVNENLKIIFYTKQSGVGKKVPEDMQSCEFSNAINSFTVISGQNGSNHGVEITQMLPKNVAQSINGMHPLATGKAPTILQPPQWLAGG